VLQNDFNREKTVTSLMFWAVKARSGLKYEHRRLQMLRTYPDRCRIGEGGSRER
jgi:hypothetical protein